MIHCYTVDLFFLAKVLIRFVFLPSIHVDEKKRKDEPCKKLSKKTGGLMSPAKQLCWKALVTYSRVQCTYTYIIIHRVFMHDVSLYIHYSRMRFRLTLTSTSTNARANEYCTCSSSVCMVRAYASGHGIMQYAIFTFC